MASGQQKAQQNIESFEAWRATQSDDDFKQITFRGQINRIEVAKGIGCGKSALNQNPALRKALRALEDDLREKGVLPPLTESAKSNADKPKQYDNTATRKMENSRRVSQLEQENIDLKARVDELEKSLLKMERYSEFHEVLEELELIPR